MNRAPTEYKMSSKKFLLRIISNTLLISAMLLIVLAWFPVLKDEVIYQWRKAIGQKEYLAGNKTEESTTPFGRLLGDIVNVKPIILTPVATKFGIVIEKIGVNAPIIQNVSVNDPKAYNDTLKRGVAHAIGTALPSDPRGNVYLFAHSSLNFWQLGQYATVFNLVRKLDDGDVIYVFYDEKRYEYSVINKQIYGGFDTYPLERRTIEPILTLQTCDPPGTTINRLVVTAKLIKVS